MTACTTFPPAGFTGRDTVTYTISDGEGGTASARVTIDVYDDPPSADPVGTVVVRDGQAISLPIGAGFRDPDGDPLTFAATGLPPGLSIDPATGTIAGSVAPSASRAANGTYTATVTADDGRGSVTAVTFDWW
ncbi:putative Ig domain-containing protein [Sphingomonas sp. MMS24-JH45]